MVDGCWQEKGVPHVRTHDDRHTGLPRPLPQLRRPPGLLRLSVGDPRACAARRGNAIHGGVSSVSRGGMRHAKRVQAHAQHVPQEGLESFAWRLVTGSPWELPMESRSWWPMALRGLSSAVEAAPPGSSDGARARARSGEWYQRAPR